MNWIKPFWDDEYKHIKYKQMPFNNKYDVFNNEPIVNWKSGDYFIWGGKVPHMAANIGVEDRYTLQITGHK